MPLSSGSSLGTYTIVAPLGTGGMGEVYRAHDPRLGRDVALKVLPAEMARDPSRLERFTREARAIAALNHPHIVTIYSTEEADGIRFLTMELVEGQSLDALIPANGMPLARFLELALPLADALNAAHQKRITHRDLKPANVIVASDGRLKVLDFGLASVSTNLPRDFSPAELVTSPQVTTPGTIIGTMPYMSPEQVEGKQLDHRTDLFSLGVMFHEMLVGTRPFSGESSPQLMSSILRDTPSSTNDLRMDVPDALSRLVARCLEKQPDDRVQTARDIYNELRHVQKQLESGSRPRPDSGSARAAPAGGTWIAVMPFTSVATDDDARTLADGLTEDITAGFARFAYLSVVAEHSARQHKGTTADVRQIGKALGARYILDGGIRRGGTSIRITARLVDAGSGAQLWSEVYTRELAQGNLLTIQDDVTDRVVATVADVHGVLMRSASVGVRGVPIERLTPEELRLRYWSYHRQHAPMEHGLLRDHFEGLAEAQPAVAPFWAVLAHLCLHEYGFGFNVKPEPLLRARHAVDRALELDSLNQHAWEALAFTLFFEQDREGFAHAADRVLALNPRNANAMALLGILFVHAGDLERGCALADRASAINPDHPGWYHIARASADYASGEFESALRFGKRINMPQHLWAHALVAMASAQLGRTAEALAALETLLGLEPAFADEAAMAAAARRWKWLPEQSEQMVDGYRKAMVLRREAARARPPSGASSATRPPSDARPGAVDMSVAVRPFTVRAGDDDAAELAEGLIENIAIGLSRFAYLRVRAAPGAGDPARSAADVSGTTSGARFVLEGGVRRSGRAVRVNVRLLEVASGTTLWAEQYDRDGSVDAFTIQDEIGDRVAATLADDGGALYRMFAAAVKTSTDEEHDPLRLFVRFAEFVEHFTREDHSRLRDEYQALVERQPSNPTAWAHLAILYGLELFFDFNPLPDAVARVRRAAERAVAIDSTHQGAWYALADAAFFERNAAAFRSAADRAIELNPLRSRTVGAIGLLRAFAGDPAEGAAIVTRAIALNPRHPSWFHLALFLDAFQRGDADRALGEAARINMPHVPVDGRLFAIAAAGRFGRAQEAAAAIAELRRDYPHLLDGRRAREEWATRIWSGELLDSLVDGFEAALNAQSAAQPASATGTGSSSATAAPLTGVSSPALTIDLAIAVRLFSSRGGESADVLAEGLTDDVTAGLSRFSYLRVVPRAVAEATLPPARYVLEGQVRRAHPHLRISARLNDTVSGATLWVENFDRAADADTFHLQDELAPRIIATIADANGVLLRSMAATLKQRPIEEHTVSDLVVRFNGFLEHFDPAEHAMIRDRLSAALLKEPGHADGWAALSSLIEHEVSHELNPQPHSLERARECAERSIAANPVCQEGWRSMASAAFFARDAAGVRVAAERAIAINPLNTATVAVCGMFLGYSGAWDRGLEVIRQAMQPNPHYPGWLHFPFYSYHYIRREYAEALQRAKQVNMPRFPKLHLCMAAVAGQLGLRDEARMAFEALSRVDASSHDDGYARRNFSAWLWREEDIDHHVEGVRKARALVAGETGA